MRQNAAELQTNVTFHSLELNRLGQDPALLFVNSTLLRDCGFVILY